MTIGRPQPTRRRTPPKGYVGPTSVRVDAVSEIPRMNQVEFVAFRNPTVTRVQPPLAQVRCMVVQVQVRSRSVSRSGARPSDLNRKRGCRRTRAKVTVMGPEAWISLGPTKPTKANTVLKF
jgi:hypothetical protein